jgi:hypothetical protein
LDGAAEKNEQALFSFLADESHQTDELVAVGCDSTNTNTGRKNGII